MSERSRNNLKGLFDNLVMMGIFAGGIVSGFLHTIGVGIIIIILFIFTFVPPDRIVVVKNKLGNFTRLVIYLLNAILLALLVMHGQYIVASSLFLIIMYSIFMLKPSIGEN